MSNTNPSPHDEHVLRVQRLFVRHQQSLLAYVLSLEPRLEDAQEIVQEVFLTVSQKAPTWTDGTNFLAWACTIARYHTLHARRSRSRRASMLADDVIDLVYPTEEDSGLLERQMVLLRECLRRLAPRARELIQHRYHANQMPEEIAPAVGWTVNAVRVALTRARDALRDCLRKQMAAEGVQGS